MADQKNKNNNSEDDFASDDFLDENEFLDELEASDMLDETPKEKPKTNKLTLPVILGAAALAFVGWKIYDMFPKTDTDDLGPAPEVASKTMPKASPAVTPEAAKAPKLAKSSDLPKTSDLDDLDSIFEPKTESADNTAPVISIEPKLDEVTETQPKPAEQVVNVMPQAVTEKLESVASKANSTDKKITEIEKDIVNLSNALKNISNNLDGMQENFSELTSSLKKMHEQLNDLEAQEAKRAKAQQVRRARAKAQSQTNPVHNVAETKYSIHAIIPGRAWVKANDGRVITLTDGDTLSPYGTIIRIDAANATIVTSSGVTIR